MLRGVPSCSAAVKDFRIPDGQICVRQSHWILWVKGSLLWSFGSKEVSRERSTKSVPLCQGSRHQSENNHLYFFIELGKVAGVQSGSYICCLEFIKPAYTHIALKFIFFLMTDTCYNDILHLLEHNSSVHTRKEWISHTRQISKFWEARGGNREFLGAHIQQLKELLK